MVQKSTENPSGKSSEQEIHHRTWPDSQDLPIRQGPRFIQHPSQLSTSLPKTQHQSEVFSFTYFANGEIEFVPNWPEEVASSSFTDRVCEDFINYFSSVAKHFNPGLCVVGHGIDRKLLVCRNCCRGIAPGLSGDEGQKKRKLDQSSDIDDQQLEGLRSRSSAACSMLATSTCSQWSFGERADDELEEEDDIVYEDYINLHQEPEDEEVDQRVLEGHTYQPVMIKDAATIEESYDLIFREMQQLPCKAVAKAWVKLIQSKKIRHHPYNGGKLRDESMRLYGKDNPGELTKPKWWPSSTGWETGNGCRHREPDHQKKEERLYFLKYILQDGRWKVDFLREASKHLGKSLEKPALAKSALEEIYQTREKQERFMNGEIDADTTIYVRMPKQSRRAPRRSKSRKANDQDWDDESAHPSLTPSSPVPSNIPPTKEQSPARPEHDHEVETVRKNDSKSKPCPSLGVLTSPTDPSSDDAAPTRSFGSCTTAVSGCARLESLQPDEGFERTVPPTHVFPKMEMHTDSIQTPQEPSINMIEQPRFSHPSQAALSGPPFTQSEPQSSYQISQSPKLRPHRPAPTQAPLRPDRRNLYENDHQHMRQNMGFHGGQFGFETVSWPDPEGVQPLSYDANWQHVYPQTASNPSNYWATPSHGLPSDDGMAGMNAGIYRLNQQQRY